MKSASVLNMEHTTLLTRHFSPTPPLSVRQHAHGRVSISVPPSFVRNEASHATSGRLNSRRSIAEKGTGVVQDTSPFGISGLPDSQETNAPQYRRPTSHRIEVFLLGCTMLTSMLTANRNGRSGRSRQVRRTWSSTLSMCRPRPNATCLRETFPSAILKNKLKHRHSSKRNATSYTCIYCPVRIYWSSQLGVCRTLSGARPRGMRRGIEGRLVARVMLHKRAGPSAHSAVDDPAARSGLLSCISQFNR